jgi:hypothetical protein
MERLMGTRLATRLVRWLGGLPVSLTRPRSKLETRNAQGADKTLRNKQDKMAIDLCQPCWSDSYRFTREVLA